MDLKPETYTNLLSNGLRYPLKIAVPAKGNYFLRTRIRRAVRSRRSARALHGDLQLAPYRDQNLQKSSAFSFPGENSQYQKIDLLPQTGCCLSRCPMRVFT